MAATSGMSRKCEGASRRQGQCKMETTMELVATEQAFNAAMTVCRTHGVNVETLTWRDEHPATAIRFPSGTFTEGYRVACGVPHAMCRDASEASAIADAFKLLPKGTGD